MQQDIFEERLVEQSTYSNESREHIKQEIDKFWEIKERSIHQLKDQHKKEIDEVIQKLKLQNENFTEEMQLEFEEQI